MRKASKWARALMVYILCIAITFTMTPVNLIAWGADETNQQTEQAQEATSEDVQQDGQNAEQFGENDQTSSDESEDQAEEPPADDQNAVADGKSDSKEEATDTDNAKSDAVTNSNADNDAADSKDEEAKKADSDKDKAKEKEKAKDEYPAAELSGSAGSVSVSIRAPKGALPKGAKLVVSPVSASEAKNILDGYIPDGKEVKDVAAVDITFLNKDGEKIEPQKKVEVTLGGLDLQGKNPVVYHEKDNGSVVKVSGDVSNDSAEFTSKDFSKYLAATLKNSDAKAGAGEAAVKHTVTFKADGSEDVTVEVEDGTAIGSSLPKDPVAESGYYFDKWVDANNESVEINEDTVVTGDITAKAVFGCVNYVVEFYASENTLYDTQYYSKSTEETLGTLPSAPSKAGSVFKGWMIYENDEATGNLATADTVVTSDMKLVATYQDMAVVTFYVEGEEGHENETVIVGKYDVAEGLTIGTLPENPFKEGYVFDKWIDDQTNEEVTANTVVQGSMSVKAVFKKINVYDVKVNYYYMVGDNRVDFDHDAYEIGDDDAPFNITPPPSTKATEAPHPDSDEAPTYYASQPTVQITAADLEAARNKQGDENNKVEKDVEYIPYTAEYDYVYWLKDADGEGYTQIKSDHVYGVLNSHVTPTVLSFDYADFEKVDTNVYIEKTQGQKLNVYYTRKNFTLSYNTGAGSYVSSVTAPYGTDITVATGDDEPTQRGYKFDGWYLDSSYETEAPATITLEKDTTLYAKWKGDTVNYTIVYMREKYNNDTGTTEWVYDRSSSASGEVGTTVVASDAPNLTNNINGYEKDADWNATSKAVIAADGSSVLVVRYKLIRYKLVFNANNGTIKMNGQTYTGSNYSIDDVVLGQDVSSMWPSNSDEIYRGTNNFGGWTGADSTYITRRYELVWENVSKANTNHVMTFTANWSGSNTIANAEYWLQQPDGTWAIADEYTQKGLHTSSLTAKNISGYTKHNGTPSGYSSSGNTTVTEQVWVPEYDDTYSWNDGDYYNIGDPYTRNGHTYTITEKRERSGFHPLHPYSYTAVCHEEGHYEDQERTVYTYRFYYDRDKYTITYYDGGTVLKTTQPIYFEADISGDEYNYQPSVPEGKDGYEWGGWYADSALQQPYTFGTMPGNNVALYANWIAPTFDVTFDLQGGSATFDTHKTVEINHKVESPGTPTKDNYEFAGWYTEPEGGTPFDWNTPISEDTTIYAHWAQETLGYTIHYYKEGTTESILPDRTVSSPAFVVGDTVTATAPSVTGFRPDAISKSIDLAFETDETKNEIIFYYSQKSATTKYTVHYVLEDHPEIKVHEDEVVQVDGSTVTALEFAAAVDYEYLASQVEASSLDNDTKNNILISTYHPKDDLIALPLTSDEENNVITFKYVNYKTTKVTVRYLDMDGNPIGVQPEPEYVKVGATYQVDRKNLSGYIYHHSVDSNDVREKEEYVFATDGELMINLYYQKKLTITAKNKSKTYDGTAISSNGLGDIQSVAGLEQGHSLTGISFDGSQTNVGSSSTTPKDAVINGPKNEEFYHITYIPGSLTVEPQVVTINIEPDRWNDGPAYDGTERTIGFRNLNPLITPHGDGTGVEISNAKFDELYGASIRNAVRNITLTKKDAGFYTIPANDIRTKITLPNDPNFKVTLNIRDGELTIPKAQAKVTTGSDSKEYDGSPLTKADASITGIIDSEKDKVEVTATGSQTEVGSSDNTYTIEWGEVNPDNYNVTDDLGTLEVTNHTATVTLTAASDSKTYDGKALTNSKVTASGLPDGFTVEATASGSQIDAGESANVVNKGYVIKDAKGADKTANFTNVKKVDGKLTVNKASLTITAKDQTYTYNGQAQGEDNKTYTGESVNEKVNVVGLADGDTLSSVKLNGKETAAGEYADKIAVSDGVVTFGHTTDKKIADNYNVTYVNGKLTITNATLTIKITGNKDVKVYNGKTQKVEGFTSNVESDLDNIFDQSKVVYSGDATASGTNANDEVYPMGLDISKFSYADENVDVTFKLVEDGQLKIDKRTVILTSASGEKEYDGTPLTKNAQSDVTVSGDGFANGEGATYNITGSQKIVGSSENTFTYTLNDGTLAGNYTITTKNGTLTVTTRNAKFKIEVEANSGTKTYDGTEKTVTGLKTDTFDVKGNTYTVSGLTASGKGTNAGEYPVNVTGTAVVKDADGNVVTEQFAVTTKPGELKINPRKVTLTSATDEKEYDGTPLTRNEQSDVKVSGDGFAKGEGATYNITGSQTVTGSSKNTFTYTLNEGTLADNYTITTVEGDLNVTDRTNKYEIEVESNSGEYVYDDQEHEASGFKKGSYEVNGQVYTVEGLTASVSGKNADTYTNTISGEAVVKDAAGNVVTDQFTVTKKEGTLTIKPRPVTFTGETATKDYTGEEIELTKVDINNGDDTGLVKGHEDNVKYSAKGTEVGEYPGTITAADKVKITKGSEDVTANYDITTVAGELTIQQDPDKQLTVELKGKDYVYDGNGHALPEVATTNAASGNTVIEYSKDGKTWTADLSSLTATTVADSCTIQVRATNPNYNNTAESTAKLTITKRPVTFIGETDTKKYTGSEIELTGITKSSGKNEGLVSGHTDNVTYSAKGTNVGNYPGTITAADKVRIMEGETDVTANYEITTTPGKLTIEQTTEKLTVSLEGKGYVYDGNEHNLPAVATTNAKSGTTEIRYSLDKNAPADEWTNDVTTLKKTDAGTYTVYVRATNPNYANTATGEAELTITKRPVAFEGQTDTRVYTGKEIELTDVTVSTGENKGLVAGHGHNVTYSAKGTEVGEYDGTITAKGDVVIKNGDEDVTKNYEITTIPGKLTIEKTAETLTVTLGSETYVYDGESHALPKAAETNAASGKTTIEYRKAAAEGEEAGAWTTDLSSLTATNVADSCKIDVRATNPNYTNTATGSATLMITKRPVAFTGETDTKKYTGSEIELTGITKSSGKNEGIVSGHTDNVTYSAKGTNVGEYDGTITAADKVRIMNGETDVTANYEITTTPGKLTIIQDPDKKLTVNLEGKSYIYDAESHELPKAAETNAATGKTTIEYRKAASEGEAAGAWTTDLSSLTATNVADSCTIDVRATNPNYANTATGSATLTITKRPVTFTGETDTKKYTGSEIELTDVTVSAGENEGLVSGHGHNVTYSTKGTEVGEYDGTITAKGDVVIKNGETDVTANYEITTTPGKLTIIQDPDKKLTVNLEGKSYIYDAESHALPKAAEINAATGKTTIEYRKAASEGEAAGAWTTDLSSLTATNVADSCTIEVRATNPNYANTATGSATLTITKRPVTFKGETDTKKYTGSEIELTGITKSSGKNEGLVSGHTDNVTYSAKGTDVGNYDGTITAKGDVVIKNRDEDVTKNYEITTIPGKLTIEKDGGNEITPEPGDEDEKLDADAKNLTVKYDGKAHTVKATATKDGSKIEYKTGGGEWSTDAPSRTNAGTTEFSIRATNPNYKDVVIDGYKLIVTKREVTLTSESDEKVYDSKALTNHKVKVSGDGFADGESAAYTFSGSRTNAGTSRNTFDVVDKNGRVMKLQAEADSKGIDEQNYDITKRYGTLTVTKAPLTITTSSASKAYDGKALTADAKVDGLVNGETVTVNATGSQIEVGSSKNTYSLKWNGTASESNYEITEHLGTLTITASPSDNVDPDPGNNGGDDPSGGGTTPPSGNTNPGRGGNGGNTPTAVNGGTTRTNGALTASTNTSSASTVTGDQKTDKAPQDLTEIEDQKTPLAKTQDKWALLNLILMILTVLLCLWMVAGTLRRNQDADRNEDEKTVKRKKILKLLSLIPAIAAVIAFILTEDMTLPMQMTDKWTILMLIIFVVQVVMRILTKNKKDEEDNNKNAYA